MDIAWIVLYLLHHTCIYRATDFTLSFILLCFADDYVPHPLRAQAMLLAKNSVMESSQKSYGSTWRKWEKLCCKNFPPMWTDQIYVTIDYDTLLDRLLMFVAYCAHEIKRHVRSIPSNLSALRHGMVSRLVKCCNAFDNELLNPSNKALHICQLRCIGHGCLVRSK